MLLKRQLTTAFNLLRERALKNTIYDELWPKLLRGVYRLLPYKGLHVMEEDWDYLIILDACRFDEFAKLNDIRGDLRKKLSIGSDTNEWKEKNFTGYHGDVVYISGNPRIAGNIEQRGFKAGDHFYKVVDVWHFGWDERLGTVPPNAVTKACLDMKEKYPSKRMIIHYIQPHAPWINKADLLPKKIETPNDKLKDRLVSKIIYKKALEKIRTKELTWDDLRTAYRNNLKLVLEDVKKLIEGLDGKVVISADHGECFGEKFLFAHPPNIYVRELVEVPWLVIEKNVRIADKYKDTEEKDNIRKRVEELKAKRKV